MDVRRALIGIFAVLITIGALHVVHLQLHAGVTTPRRPRSAPFVHVCLSTDSRDLRPAAAAIRSATVAAAEPERFVFHVVTAPDFAPEARLLLRRYVPGVRIEVHHNAEMDRRLAGLIGRRKTSRTRHELLTPLNFAPFHLEEYLSNFSIGRRFAGTRVIYIDTDVLALGDLAELADMDLGGFSCAATVSCQQRLRDVIHFSALEDLGFDGLHDPDSCVPNRAVLVIDLPSWRKSGVAARIQEWLSRDKAFERDLWDGKSGMSRPPWLLALSGDVMELGEEWNCDGLGRGSMSMVQSSLLRKSGFDHKALRSLGVKMNAMGIITPYIATCSATAKLLHFDGRLKPWRADGSRRHELPLCRAPPMLERDWHWKRAVRVFCDDVAFVGCHEIWSTFVSARVVEGLIDVNAVWREDEFRWADRSAEDLREQEASRVARAWDDMYNAEEARSHEAEGGG